MDVELILTKLAQFNFIRLNRIVGDWYSVYCPFHNDGNERRPSCGVLLHDQYRNGQVYPAGFWHCFACGTAMTMLEAVNKLLQIHGIDESEAQWLSENIPGFSIDEGYEGLLSDKLIDELTASYAVKDLQLRTSGVQNFISEDELASYRYTVPYMYDRKLTDEIIIKYDVGVDMNWIPPGRKNPVPCITFPVKDVFGRTLFICRRSIAGKLYNYPEGVVKPVYGIDKVPQYCKSLVVCESIINALTAEVYGYDAVALLGTGNSYQMDQLRRLGVSEFVLCMDGDDAGRRAAKKLKRNLKDVAMIWVVDMPDGKDLNDLSKLEFDAVYAERH